MLRSFAIGCLLLSAGCADSLQSRIAHHDARALTLESEGDFAGALREREAAERARDKLSWRVDNDREFLPPMTAFE